MPVKVKRVTVVVEYADGSKETVTVKRPYGQPMLIERERSISPGLDIDSVLPITFLHPGWTKARKFAFNFDVDAATEVVVQRDEPERPGNAS